MMIGVSERERERGGRRTYDTLGGKDSYRGIPISKAVPVCLSVSRSFSFFFFFRPILYIYRKCSALKGKEEFR